MSRTCTTSATRTVVTVKTSFKQNYIIRLHIVDELDYALANMLYGEDETKRHTSTGCIR